MIINVGSKNPAKIEAVKRAFSHYFKDFKINSFEVDSGVNPQPTSLKEIVLGAKNRAIVAFNKSKCDFSVGMEAGIFEFPEVRTGYMDMGVTVIYDGKEFYFGGSPVFEYPQKVIDAVFKKGKEVGHVFDEITGLKNAKQKQGAVGVLTNYIITRDKFMESSVIMALTRITNKKFYEE